MENSFAFLYFFSKTRRKSSTIVNFLIATTPVTAGAVSPSYWPGGLPLTVWAIGSKNCQTTDIKWTIYQEKYTLHISSMIPCPFSPMFAIVLFLIPQFVLIGLEAFGRLLKVILSAEKFVRHMRES